MNFGNYPPEYNPKVHGPYDPARYYGKGKTANLLFLLAFINHIFEFVACRTTLANLLGNLVLEYYFIFTLHDHINVILSVCLDIA